MLNNIGGKTVEEAKFTMTPNEFLGWMQYRSKYGTLNMGSRLEFLFARLSYQVHKAVNGTMEFADFLRFQDEQQASLADVANVMGVKKVVK